MADLDDGSDDGGLEPLGWSITTNCELLGRRLGPAHAWGRSGDPTTRWIPSGGPSNPPL